MEKQLISLNHLGVEVTRRCNITCSFCLRGYLQAKDIELHHIDELLDKVGHINHFCPTGGEPSLNVEAIEYFLEGCKKRNITIDSFYIATNGLNLSQKFINICDKLYKYCNKKGGVQISNDVYHLEEGKYNDELLIDKPYYTKRYKENYKYDDGQLLIHDEGLSEGWDNATRVSHESYGVLYLNVNGDVIKGCDWSYKNQEQHKLCSVEELENYIAIFK